MMDSKIPRLTTTELVNLQFFRAFFEPPLVSMDFCSRSLGQFIILSIKKTDRLMLLLGKSLVENLNDFKQPKRRFYC